ncbi:MAG: hypothetical protein ACI4NJ_12055 [Cellvibrio sp.]
MSFLRCESEPQVLDGQVVCSAWQFVSDQELMLMLSQSPALSQADFNVVAAGITSILLAAMGVRVILKILYHKGL